MKQVVAVIVLIGIGVGAWFALSGDNSPTSEPAKNGTASIGDSSQESHETKGGSHKSGKSTGLSGKKDSSGGSEGYEDYDERPAAQIYESADQALDAVKKGAEDYDDIILEQFVEPGEDCTWCDDFYGSLETLMKDSAASEDEKAYYSEILAVSGKVKNIETLVDAIKAGGDSEDAEIFAESLELTIGGDDVVTYLAENLGSESELLQESVVAAITNQGSRLAVDTLYEETVKSGDPDEYYEIGIGLGEVIPEEEALPRLQELAMQRDQYSHLSVKALLNYGHDGLVRVFDILATSQDPGFDEKMLTDAIDHVTFEEETEDYLKKVIETTNNPVAKKFAEEALEEWKLGEAEDEEYYDDYEDEEQK